MAGRTVKAGSCVGRPARISVAVDEPEDAEIDDERQHDDERHRPAVVDQSGQPAQREQADEDGIESAEVSRARQVGRLSIPGR